MTGASLTLVRAIVTVAVSVRTGEPRSVAVTVRLNAGVLSKLSAAGVLTVIWPVLELIWKASPVLPPVME